MSTTVAHHHAYWVKFENKPSACIEAESEERAKEIGAAYGAVSACTRIPYPADPRLNKFDHPQWGVCPSFCFKPEQCKGKTACPQNYSCTE